MKFDKKTIVEARVKETPQYIHDCEECIFLGRYNTDNNDYDLYYCENADFSGDATVIARYSDDGPDYTSGMCFGILGLYRDDHRTYPLTEAIKRAVKYDLVEIKIEAKK